MLNILFNEKHLNELIIDIKGKTDQAKEIYSEFSQSCVKTTLDSVRILSVALRMKTELYEFKDFWYKDMVDNCYCTRRKCKE